MTTLPLVLFRSKQYEEHTTKPLPSDLWNWSLHRVSWILNTNWELPILWEALGSRNISAVELNCTAPNIGRASCNPQYSPERSASAPSLTHKAWKTLFYTGAPIFWFKACPEDCDSHTILSNFNDVCHMLEDGDVDYHLRNFNDNVICLIHMHLWLHIRWCTHFWDAYDSLCVNPGMLRQRN